MKSVAYKRGWYDCLEGRFKNPYQINTKEYSDWRLGYQDAHNQSLNWEEDY